MVWIAKSFRDEHREALDLLNRRTGEDTEFFGVEVELWRIDDSRPAVNFNLVATPNEWRRETARNVRGPSNASEKGERYRKYYQELIDTLREEHSFTKARKAQPNNFYFFSAGYGQRVWYTTTFNIRGMARVELYIDNGDRDWNKALLDRLQKHQAVIEAKLGESPEWERLDDSRPSRIAVGRPGSIDDDEETLAEIRAWMVERLLRFKQVFGPRLDELVV